jgi:uncharacterized protein DUF4919
MGPARGKITLLRLLFLLACLWLALALLPVGATAHESPQRSEAAPQSEGAPQREAAPQSYEALLERIKRGDSTVDFGALRLALAASPAYRPYNPEAESLRKEMLSAYAAEDYDTAHDRARRLLQANYLDIGGQMVSALVEKRLGNTELARFHQFMAVSLLRSILDSGDGKSPETAYVVIATAEEYAVLNLLGLRPGEQSLIHANGHSFDRLRAVGRDAGEPVTLYFNVDLPIAWLARSVPK